MKRIYINKSENEKEIFQPENISSLILNRNKIEISYYGDREADILECDTNIEAAEQFGKIWKAWQAWNNPDRGTLRPQKEYRNGTTWGNE